MMNLSGGSKLARAVGSVQAPGGWIRAMTGSPEPAMAAGSEPGGGSPLPPSGMHYEERAVPPLPGAVAALGAHFDLFCHQYDVVPRLLGPGQTASAGE